MFSDASDSEDELVPSEVLNISWPFVRVYEREEREMKRMEWVIEERMREMGMDTDEIRRETSRGHRVFKVHRFFDTIKGFHTGDLDLSGRHLPRFEAAWSRWNRFLPDFKSLSPLVEPYEFIQYIAAIEQGIPCRGYQVKDARIWEEFRRKWRVPKSMDYGHLETLVKELQEINLGSPKIQQLCLMNLPPEILDKIFAVADLEEARLLSSTCKVLREIGARFVFTSRTLYIERPDKELFAAREKKRSLEENQDIVLAETNDNKEKFMNKAAFLLSRPDILRSLTRLSIGEKAWIICFRLQCHDRLGEHYHESISRIFRDILRNSPNLKYLSMDQVELSPQMLRIILSLRHLVTIELHGCKYRQTAIDEVLSGSITPTSSVLNLHMIGGGDQEGDNCWDIIPCFSNLRTLSMMRFWGDYAEQPMPSEDLPSHSRLFSTLKRLVLTPQVDPDDAIGLTRWIQLNASQAPLQLTHFKISTQILLEDEFILPLLDALRSAPLEVLILDGVKEGSLEMFDNIVSNFPDLLSLTVNRRENILQRKCNRAFWPHPSWEYASRFAGFRRLENFSWNYRINYEDVSSSVMLYLEANFGKSPCDDNGLRYMETMETDTFFDSEYMAYPFAAYCPTLKIFAANKGEWRDYMHWCIISRSPDGKIQLKKAMDLIDRAKVWDPVNQWPYIYRTD